MLLSQVRLLVCLCKIVVPARSGPCSRLSSRSRGLIRDLFFLSLAVLLVCVIAPHPGSLVWSVRSAGRCDCSVAVASFFLLFQFDSWFRFVFPRGPLPVVRAFPWPCRVCVCWKITCTILLRCKIKLFAPFYCGSLLAGIGPVCCSEKKFRLWRSHPKCPRRPP